MSTLRGVSNRLQNQSKYPDQLNNIKRQCFNLLRQCSDTWSRLREHHDLGKITTVLNIGDRRRLSGTQQ